MKVVSFFVGGFPVLSETFVLNQIASIVDSGIEVKIVAMTPDISGMGHPNVKKYNLINKLSTVYPNNIRFVKLLSFVLSFLNDLFKVKLYRLCWLFRAGINGYMIAKKFEYTNGIVICHFGPVGAELARLLSLNIIKDIKILTIFHGYDMSVKSQLKKELPKYKILFLHGYMMLPISDFWKGRLIELGCDGTKIKTLKMGVNLKDFKFIDKYTHPLENTIKLVCVCRFVEKKGIPVLLKAMSILPKNYQLTLIGGGKNHEKILKIIDTYGLKNKVFVEGFLPSNEVANQLRGADAFVLPSITADNGDMEGIPVVLMEAMASGLIVFSSYHSGIPELIDHEKNGFLSKENDYINLARNIQYAFEELECNDRVSIAVNAKIKVEKEFNLDKLNLQLISFLDSINEPKG